MSRVVTIGCPACDIPLRLRASPEEGERFNCPECGATIDLNADETGELFVTTAPQPFAEKPASPSIGRKWKPSFPVRRLTSVVATNAASARAAIASVTSFLSDPLAIAWLAAGGAAIVLCSMAYFTSTENAAENLPDVSVASNDSESTPNPVDDEQVPSNLPIAEEDQSEVSPPDSELDSPPEEIVESDMPEVTPPLPTAELTNAPPRTPVVAVRPKIVEPRPVPVSERIVFRVARFDTNGPKPFREVRLILSEMINTEIIFDDSVTDSEAVLDFAVDVKADDATVSQLLQLAVAQAELRFEIDGRRIVLYPANSPEEL